MLSSSGVGTELHSYDVFQVTNSQGSLLTFLQNKLLLVDVSLLKQEIIAAHLSTFPFHLKKRVCTLWSFISLVIAVHIHWNEGRSSGSSDQHSDITEYLKEQRALLRAQKQDLFLLFNFPVTTSNTSLAGKMSVCLF